jgi:4'-phosphopantetheinyl transferase
MQVFFHNWDNTASAPPAASAPACDQVQVWLATVPPDDTDISTLTLTLSQDERKRAERFKIDQPRRQFVFAHHCLRQLLGAVLGVEPRSLIFGSRANGKPCLAPSTDLRFNLSHSGRLVAIALTRGREVGVDIEWMHPLADWRQLAGRIFSPREQETLFALPESQQSAAFFNGWTRKEAWLKATGEGLTDALPAIEVTLAPGKVPAWISLPGGQNVLQQWTLYDLPLPDGYAGAVVLQDPSRI